MNIFLQLLVSSLISFISVLQFSIYRSLVSLGRYTPRYLILFVAMVNGIVSLISFSSLIAVAKPSKTMLNSSGESGHPCLVPDFGGMLSIFYH